MGSLLLGYAARLPHEGGGEGSRIQPELRPVAEPRENDTSEIDSLYSFLSLRLRAHVQKVPLVGGY